MRLLRGCTLPVVLFVCATVSYGQQSSKKVPGSLLEDMREFVETPAVPGYEQELAARIAGRLKAYSPKVDAQSNVIVTVGSGSPHRLLVAPMDEPGFVVSRITPDGYLQLQRLPQGGNLPLFNDLYAAQPVKIETTGHKWISGSVGGLSVHLQPGRQHAPSPADLDEVYVDVGAASASQARAAGVDLLSPLAIERTFFQMGNGEWTAPAIGDRFGDAALVEVLRSLDPAKLHGTLTVAFVAQQWSGARGLQRMLYEQKPDELIYVGRLVRPAAAAGQRETTPQGFAQTPGAGVLIASQSPANRAEGLADDLSSLGAKNNIPVKAEFSAALIPRSYLPGPPLPSRNVHLSIATAWPSTPGEFVDGHDVAALIALLENYLEGSATKTEAPASTGLPNRELPKKPATAPTPETIIRELTETAGVSGGHEGPVTDTIERLLPAWAKPVKDDAGNLILKWPGNAKALSIVVVAHQDEIGYEVRSVLPDGTLELQSKGGGTLNFFLGHAALVHSANGVHPGVMELPEGWEKSDFQWPRGGRVNFRMDVGARTPEQVAQLGIKSGDFVTIPKKYHKLLGTRSSARSFDDRVGCTALIAAAWALGPDLKNRNVTFVWSTSEELGLEGAGAVAKRLAAEGHPPDYVFAVDTFVSSDSPIESPRFADAILGKGFVVRSIDNSSITPRNLTAKLVALSAANKIPVQYGITGGGNDGSAFLTYGTTDIALGWPLRFSHSPGEVIDTRDMDGLGRIIAALARSW